MPAPVSTAVPVQSARQTSALVASPIRPRKSLRIQTKMDSTAFTSEPGLSQDWLAGLVDEPKPQEAAPSFDFSTYFALPELDVPPQDTPPLMDDHGSPPFGLSFESAFGQSTPPPLFGSPEVLTGSLPPTAFIQPAIVESGSLSPLELSTPLSLPRPRRGSSLKREHVEDDEDDGGGSDFDYDATRSVSPAPAPVITKRGGGRRPAGSKRRQSSTPLLDVEAPTVERKYKVASRTSKKARPAAMEREIEKAVENGEDVDEVIDTKRRRNTIAARISRQRKADHLAQLEARAARVDDLEALVAALEAERDHWRSLATGGSTD